MRALDEQLPDVFRGKNSHEHSAAWPTWLAAFKTSVLERVVRGDEDTLVNFLLFIHSNLD